MDRQHGQEERLDEPDEAYGALGEADGLEGAPGRGVRGDEPAVDQARAQEVEGHAREADPVRALGRDVARGRGLCAGACAARRLGSWGGGGGVAVVVIETQGLARVGRHGHQPRAAVVPGVHGRRDGDGVHARRRADGHGREVEVKHLRAVGLGGRQVGVVPQDGGHVVGVVLVHVGYGALLGDRVDAGG